MLGVTDVFMTLAVVIAFKIAYTLEKNRRDNDRKVGALFVTMKDMIAVLTQ